MSDFQKYYKKPPSTFGNMKKIRASLVREQQTRRNKWRTRDIEEIRVETLPCSIPQNDNPRKKLDWKAEQKKEKQSEQKKEKPPFVVGIVRHRIYSPPLSFRKIVARTTRTVLPAHINSNSKKGITKATQKRLLAKATKAEMKQLPSKTTSATSNDQVKSDVNRRTSFAPLNHKFKPPAGLPEIPLFKENFVVGSPLQINIFEHDKSTEIKIEKPDSSQELPETSSVSDKVATNGAIIENSAVPINEKKYSVEYFKRVSDEEKNRLQNLCDEWMKIQSQHDIPEDIRYLINQTVGQTTMLIKEKFKQFHVLILDCERNDGDILITCMDLHGFWDLVYIEIKDCDARFEKLKTLRARGWKEDKLFTAQSTTEKTFTKKKVVSAKRSSLRASILPDKKKRMSQIQDNDENSQQVINNQCVTPFITNKAVKVFRKSTNNVMCNRFLEASRKVTPYLYTSTPVATTSNILSRFSTSFITMKVNQLYNKSIPNDTTLHITPERTAITRENSIDKSLRNDSLRIQLTHEKSVEISQNSEASSKETHKFKPVSIENDNSDERLDFEIENSVQTVIEKTIRDKSTTLIASSSYNTDLIKTPTESTRSFKKSLSNKSLKIKPALNNLSTPRHGSLIHTVLNISSEITSTTNPIKKRNSNMKRSYNSTYGNPKVSGIDMNLT